jgi:hypothetical protein
MRRRIGQYILTHWRGEQSLLRSCLINGVACGLLAGLLVSYAGRVIWFAVGQYCAAEHAAFCTASWAGLSFRAYVSLPFDTLVPLVWGVWAVVGIARAGRRVAFDPAKTSRQRGVGFAAIALAILLTAWKAAAVGLLVYEERGYAELEPCRVDGRSAACDAVLAARHADVSTK